MKRGLRLGECMVERPQEWKPSASVPPRQPSARGQEAPLPKARPPSLNPSRAKQTQAHTQACRRTHLGELLLEVLQLLHQLRLGLRPQLLGLNLACCDGRVRTTDGWMNGWMNGWGQSNQSTDRGGSFKPGLARRAPPQYAPVIMRACPSLLLPIHPFPDGHLPATIFSSFAAGRPCFFWIGCVCGRDAGTGESHCIFLLSGPSHHPPSI